MGFSPPRYECGCPTSRRCCEKACPERSRRVGILTFWTRMDEHQRVILSEDCCLRKAQRTTAVEGSKPRVHATPAMGEWQRRFYDFNGWSAHQRIEKLRCMRRNPLQRWLVLEPNNGSGAASCLCLPGRKQS